MLYVAFFVIVFIGFTAYGGFVKAKQRDAWAIAAMALGLQSTRTGKISGESRMAGPLGDVRVDVYTESRGSGDNRHIWTIYEITFRKAGPDVTLKRAGTMSRLRRAVGFDDVLIGHDRFDDSVDVIANSAEDARNFLTPSRQAAVLSLFEMFPRAEVSSSRILVASQGAERKPDRLISNTKKLAEMARLISGSPEVDHALGLEAQGDLGAGADALAAAQASDPNLYIKLLEAEARVAMGERRRAAQMLTELEVELPDDPEVAGWHKVADQTPMSPSEERATMPPPPSLLAADLDVPSVMTDLFANNRPSYEVEERFSNAYRGAAVTWSGTVLNSRAFASDRDFGNSPGLKATVNVGSLGDGRLVSDQIDAIVELDSDAAVERGDVITFTGTLHRVDRFMRNIYITDADIHDRQD